MSPRVTIQPRRPFFVRVRRYALSYAAHYLVRAVLAVMRFIHPEPASTRPTFVRFYPCRSKLANRIFLPKSYERDSSRLLPLFLSVHGGGFSLCDPQIDDSFASHLANSAGIIVASINYSKAPASRYPVPMSDVAAIMDAVINDASLPIDKDRVAVGGFSAGGNLSLTAAQTPLLKGKLKAAVPIYPVLDWVATEYEKYDTRRRKGREAPDSLVKSGPLFKWAYVPVGTNLEDPLLSPFYAERSALPPWLFFVCSEDDMLCHETEELSDRFAKSETEGGAERVELDALEDVEGWTCGRLRLERMLGWHHGFTHTTGKRSAPQTTFESEKEREERRLRVTDALYDRVGEWLHAGPFA